MTVMTVMTGDDGDDGDDGWKRVVELLESYYKKDDNAEAFETWKEFRTFCKRTTKLLKVI